ncbi:MAG: hypothetical protein GX625_16665, partial [Clostridiaceae bacterium]|nr:hypothetical protein [Clostridiaceae bacterium]
TSYGDYTDLIAGLDDAIAYNESSILAMGAITITARYLNVNGLIQSGVDTIVLDIAANFNPGNNTTSFVDDEGNVLAGISFGAQNIPVDGYYDAEKHAIVLDDIVPQGGKITLAGQIFSTGNGQIKVAHGYTSVDIDNNSSYDLILNRIDTTTERVGEITIIDTDTLRRVDYEVDADQVVETVSYGVLVENATVEDGVISRIVYTVDHTTTHGINDAIFYEPQDGLMYVWTDGQGATRTTVYKYEKKSFNLFGDNALADWLVADNSYKWREISFTDDYYLLFSESLVDTVSSGVVYSLEYEQLADVAVDVLKDITLVRDLSTGIIYRYRGDDGELALVSVDITTGALTPIIDYAGSDDWEVAGDVDPATYEENPAVNQLDSDYRNYSFDVKKWTTGGGWLRKKTVHTLITQIESIKDYYTHSLKADYPIEISFIAGAENPSINIESEGNIYLYDNISSPENGTINIVSQNGSVTSNTAAAIYGVSPTITADEDVKVNIEGDKGALDINAGGDIELSAVSLDNIS